MVDSPYAQSYSLEDLKQIMLRLRAPDGCPWDRAQTHHSIRSNMIEEAYEAAEAIDNEDDANLKEELGDVLLQVVFHSCMAQERGSFTLEDVIDGICQKLVYRHPHVFGEESAEQVGQALETWESQKRTEKGQKTVTDQLNGVARALPALMRAQKIQAKARKAGFDWPDIQPSFDKVDEELAELRQAAADGTNVEEELGDLLYSVAKVGRLLEVDGEQALHATCEKFIRRFRYVEEHCGEGKTIEDMELSALEELWRRAKHDET